MIYLAALLTLLIVIAGGHGVVILGMLLVISPAIGIVLLLPAAFLFAATYFKSPRPIHILVTILLILEIMAAIALSDWKLATIASSIPCLLALIWYWKKPNTSEPGEKQG